MLVAGDIEVLEKTGQVDGDAVWRHIPGQINPPGLAIWVSGYPAIWLFGYLAICLSVCNRALSPNPRVQLSGWIAAQLHS
jgi:hypothetical protein